MRLIDADKLKEELKERGLLSAIHSLDKAPTVQALTIEDIQKAIENSKVDTTGKK